MSLVLLAVVLAVGAARAAKWWHYRQAELAEERASRDRINRLQSSQPDEEELEAERFLSGHRQGVQALAFSPDGSVLVSGGSEGLAMVWDFASGKTRHVLNGHEDAVWGVAVSGDGSRVATAGGDGQVMVWDAATGELTAILEGHRRRVYCVHFLPDGTLLSGGLEGTIRRWDVRDEKELAVLEGHRGAVHSIAVSRDGRRVASGSQDGTVIVWDLEARRPAWRVAPPAVSGRDRRPDVNWVAFSPDGKKLYTSQLFGYVNEFDAETGEHLRQLEDFNYGITVDISPDGTRAAVGTGRGPSLWNLGRQKIERVLTPETMTHAIAFSPDGRHVVAGHGRARDKGYDDRPDPRVSVWDVSKLPAPKQAAGAN